jgi:hypothetical protein
MTAPVDFAPGDFLRVQAAANALQQPTKRGLELKVERAEKRAITLVQLPQRMAIMNL